MRVRWSNRGKYGNIQTIYNGRSYASKKEATRAFELDMLKKAGEVKEWEAQPRFTFRLNGLKICDYIGDFKVEYPNGKVEIEDVKSEFTRKKDTYRIKKKMMKAFFNIDVVEVL